MNTGHKAVWMTKKEYFRFLEENSLGDIEHNHPELYPYDCDFCGATYPAKDITFDDGIVCHFCDVGRNQ